MEVPSPVRAYFAEALTGVDHEGFVVMPSDEYHLSLDQFRVPEDGGLSVVAQLLDDLAELWPLPPCWVVGFERWNLKPDRLHARFLVVRHGFGRAWVNFVVELRKRLRSAGFRTRRRHVIPHVTLMRSRDYCPLGWQSKPTLPPIRWAPASIVILASDPGPPRRHIVHHRSLLGGGAGACVEGV
ncbi:MAG TPA: hypothetical protein PLX09_02600 [Xanthomonadaceae bacterium]|nr:hypothetical protein [Xanthomonadaceae bacterium]